MVDEIGYLPMSLTGGMLFFQLINQRYERASTVLTCNKSFEDWGQILGDEVMAAALLDRLLRRCHIVNIPGNSYRMRQHTDLARVLHAGQSATEAKDASREGTPWSAAGGRRGAEIPSLPSLRSVRSLRPRRADRNPSIHLRNRRLALTYLCHFRCPKVCRFQCPRNVPFSTPIDTRTCVP